MFLVQGCIFGVRANSKAPEFSLNARQCTSSEVESVGNSFSPIYLRSCSIVIASRSDWDKAMYSASVADIAICVCSFLNQTIGQPAYRME